MEYLYTFLKFYTIVGMLVTLLTINFLTKEDCYHFEDKGRLSSLYVVIYIILVSYLWPIGVFKVLSKGNK